jgi:hypothetical protein
MRRRLRVGKSVEVRGPHGPTAASMWGEAAASEDVPLVVVESISGLAATDPEWDGQGTFRRQDPDCPGPILSEDKKFYVKLWKRARMQMN